MRSLCFATAVFVSFSAALAHATLEVRPGVNITLSCSNLAKDQTQVDWFRVTNGTNASCVSSMMGLEHKPSYCQGFKSGKFVMSSNKTDLFLSIEAVDSSDAGLYFCGFFMTSNIVLGETTYLKVTDDAGQTNHLENTDHPAEERWLQVMVLSLSSLSLVLFIVVLILSTKIQKQKKEIKDLQDDVNRTPAEDVVYAALQVRPKQRPAQTALRSVEPHVIYSCTK